MGIIAQDYFTNRVQDIEKLYSGKRVVLDFNEALIDKLYQNDGMMHAKESGLENLLPNEYLILKNQQKSALAVYNDKIKEIHRVEKRRAYNISPRNAEQTFALNALLGKRFSKEDSLAEIKPSS